jgi:hypothetical protein
MHICCPAPDNVLDRIGVAARIDRYLSIFAARSTRSLLRQASRR